jgi:hypothetical protein
MDTERRLGPGGPFQAALERGGHLETGLRWIKPVRRSGVKVSTDQNRE